MIYYIFSVDPWRTGYIQRPLVESLVFFHHTDKTVGYLSWIWMTIIVHITVLHTVVKHSQMCHYIIIS